MHDDPTRSESIDAAADNDSKTQDDHTGHPRDALKERYHGAVLPNGRSWMELFDQLPGILALADTDGNIVCVNRNIRELVTEPVIGQPVFECLNEECHAGVREFISQAGDEADLAPRYLAGELNVGGEPVSFQAQVKRLSADFGGMIVLSGLENPGGLARLKGNGAALEIEKGRVQSAQTALNVLLRRQDNSQNEIGEQVLHNVRDIIRPLVQRLKKSGLTDSQKASLGLIETQLENITAPFARALSLTQLKFTTNEIQVANFIHHGLSSRQIAELTNRSVRTVETYRDRIRTKLNIKKSKINLQTYLTYLISPHKTP